MAEFIGKEEFLEFCDKRLPKMVADPDGLHPISLEVVMVAIKNWPAADVAPVVHGRWMNVPPYRSVGGDYLKAQECSVCGAFYVSEGNRPYSNHNYCPNCGADMRGE